MKNPARLLAAVLASVLLSVGVAHAEEDKADWWIKNFHSPSEFDAWFEQQIGIKGAGTWARGMDEGTLRDILNKLGIGGAAGAAGIGAGIASQMNGSQDMSNMTDEQAAAMSQSFESGLSGLIGRSGDVFVFCYEGGEGGSSSQGWYPVMPATGSYTITRYCSGAPCPNWTTLSAYQQICPKAVSMGFWKGPGGPGAIGQYQSSGGSQYKGDPNSVSTGSKDADDMNSTSGLQSFTH